MHRLRDLIHRRPHSEIDIRKGEYGFSIYALQEEVNRLFNHFYNDAVVHLTRWNQPTALTPPLNIAETPAAFYIEVSLPGIAPEDVKLEAADGLLTISGERKRQVEAKGDGEVISVREEIPFGAFSRNISLPETADAEKIDAVFRQGILTVSVSKKAQALQNMRKVEIRSAA